jgi:oxygen-independent coproporphyrinogen-3 oxidase
VYMLEVDVESRLGTELLVGGSRYHAHFVPDEDLTADLYLAACERLEKNGVRQYEISNFARPVTHGMGLRDSRHNLKYWTRAPYFGFGVDAHSMLNAGPELKSQGVEAVRFATPDSLEGFSEAGNQLDPAASRAQQLKASRTLIDAQAAMEESFFLGLRMNRGVSLAQMRQQFGDEAIGSHEPIIAELTEAGLLERLSERLQLTSRGRLLSNEVFERFLHEPCVAPEGAQVSNFPPTQR